jgi:hypothetical protein
MIAVMMHFNVQEKLLCVKKFKKDITDRAQQPKSNAQPVKRAVVVMKHVNIVTSGRIKIYQATPRAANVQLDLVTKL